MYADREDRWNALSYEQRLVATEYVFSKLVEHAADDGTFRHLIYSRLGFREDAYAPLYTAGGMTISNEFILTPFSINDREMRTAMYLLENSPEIQPGSPEAEALKKVKTLLDHYAVKSFIYSQKCDRMKAELQDLSEEVVRLRAEVERLKSGK